MNIFEIASRKKLRFPSIKGELTVEQLWDLPLQSVNKFDLDSVARAVNSQLKAVTEESFVATSTSPEKSLYELQLDIVKHMIATRLAENEAARLKTARAEELKKLTDILADKQDEALKSMSPDQIKARIAKLQS